MVEGDGKCVRVCVYACVYACVYVCVYVCVHAYTCGCAYVCVCVRPTAARSPDRYAPGTVAGLKRYVASLVCEGVISRTITHSLRVIRRIRVWSGRENEGHMWQ